MEKLYKYFDDMTAIDFLIAGLFRSIPERRTKCPAEKKRPIALVRQLLEECLANNPTISPTCIVHQNALRALTKLERLAETSPGPTNLYVRAMDKVQRLRRTQAI
jgi:hypothetical protein